VIYLPIRAQEVCETQGWDDQTLIIHLIGFIAEQSQHSAEWGEELAEYFKAVADEENQPLDPETREADNG